MSEEMIEKVADRICLDVCELPDRTSPDDWPEACLVTSEELHAIVTEALSAYNPNERLREALEAIQAIAGDAGPDQAVISLIVAFDEIREITKSALSPLPQGEDT